MGIAKPENYWKSKLEHSVDALKMAGFDIVEELSIFPKISTAHIDDFCEKTDIKIPDDLYDFFTNHMGGFEFMWGQPDDLDLQLYMGGYEGGFIGAKTDYNSNPLMDAYQDLQNYDLWYQDHEEDVDENNEILDHCLPLSLCCGGGADVIVLRLDCDPSEILYLDHEMSHRLIDAKVLEKGFYNFMDKWSDLYFAEIEECSGVYNHDTGELDVKSEAAIELIDVVKGAKI